MRYHVNFRDLRGQAATTRTAGARETNAHETGVHEPEREQSSGRAANAASSDQSAFQREAEKLHRHLADYKADLVDVWGSVEKMPRSGGYVAHLRVHLPTGTISAEGRAYSRLSAWTAVTNELIVRIERHKARLSGARIRRQRRDRRRATDPIAIATMPQTEISQTGIPQTGRPPSRREGEPGRDPADDASRSPTGPQAMLVNAYPALLEYLTNEVERHEASGELAPRTVDASDLLDETALIVLDRPHTKPDGIAFDHWIFKVAHERILDQITRAKSIRAEAIPSLDTVMDRLEGPEGFVDEDDLVRELIGPNPRRRYGYDIPAPRLTDESNA